MRGLTELPSPNDTLKSVKIVNTTSAILSIYAPKASEVMVSGDFPEGFPGKPLSKNETGVWSVALENLSPNLYSYSFRVDGVSTFDPKNPRYKEGENSLSNIFEIPENGSEFFQVKDVPHGKIEQVWFQSKAVNKPQRMHVYTPPGYEKMEQDLPILYLQHGGGDNDASWTTVGKANFILDNLLAEGKIIPMIVVMAMGHPSAGFFMNPGTDEDPYFKVLCTDIMPYVESHYHVSTKRELTAFAGLSMGGIQAFPSGFFIRRSLGMSYL